MVVVAGDAITPRHAAAPHKSVGPRRAISPSEAVQFAPFCEARPYEMLEVHGDRPATVSKRGMGHDKGRCNRSPSGDIPHGIPTEPWSRAPSISPCAIASREGLTTPFTSRIIASTRSAFCTVHDVFNLPW